MAPMGTTKMTLKYDNNDNNQEDDDDEDDGVLR
jgi:hypothetical protein